VRGEERYFREEAIASIVAAAKERGFDVARHDALDPDFDVRAVLDDLSAAPLFSAARLIVVRGASALLKKEGRDAAPLERALLSYLRGSSPAGSVVAEAESLRIDHAVAKALIERGGIALSCRRLWETPPPWDPDPRKAEVVQWLVSRARARKVAIGIDEAAYVVQATGNDLQALDAALDRVAQRKSRSVEEVVEWTSAASPFQIAEHLCRGDVARALAGIQMLFRSGFEERDGSREIDPAALLAVLFGSLRSKLRQTLSASLALERGLSLADAARSAGTQANPRALGELEERVALRAPRAWRAMIEDLAVLERRTRSAGTVDAGDLAALCLRWRLSTPNARRAAREGTSHVR
jgi:DNA polymerase III delta subunit